MALELEARTPVGGLELALELVVRDGETLVLAGPSGAGKTSVLRVAAGLMRPRQGRVSCGGQLWLDTEQKLELPPERRRCGYVFQDYALFPHMSALDNVAYGLGGPRKARRARALGLLHRLGVEDLARARPSSLSGGEAQRVALARALAPQPSVLLLDEPLSALDVRTRASAARVLTDALEESGTPALLVTHEFSEAALLGDRVAVIDGGRIVQTGAPERLAAVPASAFVADFTGAVVLTGTARAGADALTRVALDGGGQIASVDPIEGPVAASVYPWEITLEPPQEARHGSAQNRLSVSVTSVTQVGNRVRVGLAAPQPLAAEVTLVAAHELGIVRGAEVTASWKAAATRLVRR